MFATSNEAFAEINEVFNESWSGSSQEASMRPEDLEAELDAILGLQSNPEPPAPPPSATGLMEAQNSEASKAVRVPMTPLAPKTTITSSTDSLPSTPSETPELPIEDTSPPTYSGTESKVCADLCCFVAIFVRLTAALKGVIEAAAVSVIVALTIGPLVAYAMFVTIFLF